MTTAFKETALPALTDCPDRAEQDLKTHGLCLLGDVLTAAQLERSRRALYQAAADDRDRGIEQSGFGLDYGDGNQRVWNVLSRDPVFTDLVAHPVALRLVRTVLGWPALLGNLSANIAHSGARAGVLHADQIFVPEPWPAAPQGINLLWCLDAYTETNGATEVVVGSQALNRLPREGEHCTPMPVLAPGGTLVAFDSRLWHRSGANRDAAGTRAGLFAWYSSPIYRTQENWFLSLNPQVLEGASDELLTLLAYKTRGFGLVNGHSPR